MRWWNQIQGIVRRHEPLKRHTTFRIGGAADFFVAPRDIADLRLLVTFIRKEKKNFFVAGAGSNLLADDEGFRGVVIVLSSPAFSMVRFDANRVCAGAGLALAGLVNACARRGLSGIEFLAGIPGSVGGALRMNAGAWGKKIEDFVENVTVMDYNGEVITLEKKDMGFTYRHADLRGMIVLECVFKLVKRERGNIRKKISRYREQRSVSQDLSFPSAGCIFRNPSPEQPAGMLIDQCGLKGFRRGGAMISVKHANFIINRSGASSRDVKGLMRLMRERVRKEFGVTLEPEIIIVPRNNRGRHR
jgi:UDP-N-acetylmuramate dehydrogenase